MRISTAAVVALAGLAIAAAPAAAKPHHKSPRRHAPAKLAPHTAKPVVPPTTCSADANGFCPTGDTRSLQQGSWDQQPRETDKFSGTVAYVRSPLCNLLPDDGNGRSFLGELTVIVLVDGNNVGELVLNYADAIPVGVAPIDFTGGYLPATGRTAHHTMSLMTRDGCGPGSQNWVIKTVQVAVQRS